MDKNVEELFEKIARLEMAAKRGLQINEEIKPHSTQGQVISVEYCNTTLKHCALFRRWINECLGS
ncbi:MULTISPECIES: hypothetical protein [Enterobacter]|uniref:hypothetical protein n=1 Tax=Enterobacter TaxID=547 RepID=UPI0007351767|nr:MULTISPECIES: hypothetical protein [Enterobacter]KTH22668.1 hypothetical protein ASV29_17275 [Enterobacter cloacae subsp. cloacae]KTH24350.1 hypothetical protein ASV28_16090 [Enterobacter cloacae subsp. cloacae]MCK6779346.1 hypothetical protein [Enterobacter bugandensis]MCK6867362.1 hypothetical protein [Enterobacter kobei]MCM2489741.1 hypothetical protein [Enterobacter cloacae]